MRNCKRWLAVLQSEHGISLLEVLVAVAITATISTVIATLMFTTMRSSRAMLQKTDQYESLRVASASIMGDARFATRAACDWDYLRLYTNQALTSYVVYKFASFDGVTEAEDPRHLHRWVFVEGVFQSDEVVGWDMVPYDPWTWEGTEFGCEAFSTSRRAFIRLVKPAVGRTPGAVLEVTALLR